LRITDRPQLPMVQGTQQQTATAKTTAAAPTPTPAQANPMERMFATQFDAPVARMAAAGDVLPPAQTPPTDERLNRAIDHVFKDIYERYNATTPRFPTGQQRTDLMNMAKEMRNKGKSAMEIEHAIADKLHLIRQGLDNTTDDTINGLIDKTFEFVNKMYGGVEKAPTPQQRTELMKLAHDMKAKGKGAQDIQHAIADKVHSWRRDLSNTSETKIDQLITKTFEFVAKMYGGVATSPTPEQRDELMKLGKKLSAEGKDAQQIENAIADKVHAMRRDLGNTSETKIHQLITKTFEFIHKMYEGIDKTPTASQREELMQLGKKMSAEGKDAQQIEHAIADKVHTWRQGLDKTDDPALNRFIDTAFKKVFENPNRVPSERERSVWLKFAQELAKKGMNGQSVSYALQDALRTSLHNL